MSEKQPKLICFVGRQGAGKTRLTKDIIEHNCRWGKKTLILDFNGEYTEYENIFNMSDISYFSAQEKADIKRIEFSDRNRENLNQLLIDILSRFHSGILVIEDTYLIDEEIIKSKLNRSDGSMLRGGLEIFCYFQNLCSSGLIKFANEVVLFRPDSNKIPPFKQELFEKAMEIVKRGYDGGNRNIFFRVNLDNSDIEGVY